VIVSSPFMCFLISSFLFLRELSCLLLDFYDVHCASGGEEVNIDVSFPTTSACYLLFLTLKRGGGGPLKGYLTPQRNDFDRRENFVQKIIDSDCQTECFFLE